MAGPIRIYDASYKTATDLSAKQFRVVIAGDGTNDVTVESTETDATPGTKMPLGILQNAPGKYSDVKVGIAARVRKLGVSKAISAGPISRGDLLEPTKDGRVKRVSAASGTAQIVVGIAEDKVTAADTILKVFLTLGSYTV
jgi:hypothetical protein